MAEQAILDIARRLDAWKDAEAVPAPHSGGAKVDSESSTRLSEALHGIPGSAFVVSSLEKLRDLPRGSGEDEIITLPSHDAIVADPAKLLEATLALERQAHQGTQWAVQESEGRQIVFTPPADSLSTEELDALYALPYTRRPHPIYTQPIPAARMIQFSVTSHRGCAAGCTFCSITLHQGRQIRSRSAQSLKEEVLTLTRHPDWAGSISDVGGPTANMWGARCTADPSVCRRVDCLTPKVCRHFETHEAELIHLLRTLRAVDGVKHLRVASGVRYDLAGAEGEYLRALVREFVGGQLKIAPEHRCDHVLRLMRKPRFETFERFLNAFERESHQAHKEQYVIPYLISAFPGCTDEDMQALAEWLRERGWKPQQVQCFIPTPGTVATAMFYAGIDSHGNPISVARTDKERMRQHYILAPKGKP
jgi:uncharacterized radical SAM protein YgiQ